MTWLMLLLGCADPASEAPAPAPVVAVPSVALPEAVPPAAEPPSMEVARVAVVKEVLKTDRYTFLRMDACGQEAWVAGPPMEVEVGMALGMPAGLPMANFESVSLKRTFDSILFVDWMSEAEGAPECAPPVMPTDKQRIGVVMEKSEAGGYVYAKLDHCGKQYWIATNDAPMQVGATIITDLGSVMTNFSSPSTGVKYDEIVFVTQFAAVPGAPLCD
jgi:hypothetical protein